MNSTLKSIRWTAAFACLSVLAAALPLASRAQWVAYKDHASLFGVFDEYVDFSSTIFVKSVTQVLSEPALLTMIPPDPVRIVLGPASQAVYFASNVTFGVQASGDPPITYQWYKDAQPIPEATLSNLTLRNVHFHDAGAYHVVVSNEANEMASDAATLVVLAHPSSGRPGEVDLNFSVDAFTPCIGVTGIEIQSNNQAILAGHWDRGMIRVQADGSYDPEWNYVQDEPWSLRVLPDDRVVGGGFVSVHRVLPGGEQDATFQSNCSSQYRGWIFDLAVQPDGKVIVGGDFVSIDSTPRQQRLVRLDTDGPLDPGFDPGLGPDGRVTALALLEDGRILVGGHFSRFDGEARQGLVRLHPDGSLDATFRARLAGFSGIVEAILLSGDRILIGGKFDEIDGRRVDGLARLRMDGSLDPTFHFHSKTGQASIYTITEAWDGRLVVGGAALLTRLLPNGEYDPSFNPELAVNKVVTCSAIDLEGRILVGGSFTEIAGVQRPYIVRLFGGGPPWLGIEPSADHGVRLFWPAPSADYRLQFKEQLDDPQWQDASNEPGLSDDQFWLTFPPSAPARFFRLHAP